MAQKKITELQQISAMTDGSSIPTDNGIQTYRVTGSQLKTYFAPIYVPPSFEELTSSGTWNKHYAFVVSAASATVGATYTHNAVTYTVIRTVSSSDLVILSGNAAPLSSGTLTKASGTGDSSIAFTLSKAPVYLEVFGMAGGGGGSGSGTALGGTGTAGGSTTFGSSLLTATGGSAGAFQNATNGVGGSPTITAPAYGIGIPGGNGGGRNINGTASSQLAGSPGGQGALGGGSFGSLQTDLDGKDKTGGGGCGGGTSGTSNSDTGTGGGAGAFFRAFIPSPSATYAYAVGSGGGGGTAGTNGFAGGDGGDGYLAVICHFQ